MQYQMNEDFLMHFGVPGMRWGHRKTKTRDITTSRMTKKKLYKKVDKFSKKKKSNVAAVDKKFNKELEESKEYKDFKSAAETFQKNLRSKQGASLDDLNRYNQTGNKMAEKRNKMVQKYKNEYAGSLLRDLKYEDTKAGRDYVNNLLYGEETKKKK